MMEVLQFVDSPRSLACESKLAGSGLFKVLNPEQLQEGTVVATQQAFTGPLSNSTKVEDITRDSMQKYGIERYGAAYHDREVIEHIRMGNYVLLRNGGEVSSIPTYPFPATFRGSALQRITYFMFYTEAQQQ